MEGRTRANANRTMRQNAIQIGTRRIASGQPCFVIAEAGVNHNGQRELAHRLVDLAAEAGVDAVKFQTFKAERLVTPQAPKANYQAQTTGGGESQLDMLKKLEISAELHVELMEHCQQRHIQFLSTPFEEESVDLLVRLGAKALKIPSGEITNLPLLHHVAAQGLPTILSTGMASLGEVDQAVSAFRTGGEVPLALLHCVSNYPADPADCNLRAMHTLETAFEVPVGFSDHTLGIEIALGAVAVGACIIEKHFTVDRHLPGPDHPASIEPGELAELVRGIRKVESALGTGRKGRASSEQNTADVARKSIVAVQDIAAGEALSAGKLALRRPGTGLPSTMLPWVTGRTPRHAIAAGTLITLEMLS